MSKLLYVPFIGRWGNLLFQYCYARAWAEKNGYELCLPPWVGEKVFTIPEAVRPDRYKPDLVWPEDSRQNQQSLIYTRKQVREWLAIKPEVLEQLQVLDRIRDPILLDVRQHSDCPTIISRQSYIDACNRFGYDARQAGWELDTNPTRLPYFTGDVTAAGWGTTWVSLPAFYRIMTAPVLFRAVSTFSWWAATLSAGKVYAPIIRGLIRNGIELQCNSFVEGNWPVMSDNPPNTDLFLQEA